MKKNLIIDGNNVASAVFCVLYKDLEEEDFKEIVSSAVSLFNTMIRNFKSRFNSEDVFIAWDSGGAEWRREVLPEYKANRKEKDPIMQTILEACRLNNYATNIIIAKTEGDDVIYNLCRYFKDDKNIIISSDKDFLQVVQEGLADSLYNFIQKKFREMPDICSIQEKALCGDSSDNLKGIPGIGPVKARKIIKNNFNDLSKEQLELYNKHVLIIGLKNNPNNEEILKSISSILGDK